MRLVVATILEDPLAAEFWGAYNRAGGPPPAAVLFLPPRRKSQRWRSALEGALLFGPGGSLQWWRLGRRIRETISSAPEQVFRGAGVFHHITSLNGAEGRRILGALVPDLLVSVGAPEVFRPHVLGMPTIGAINVHNGKLPAYRGLFGTFWETFNGEEWGYSTIHVMQPQVDSGAVLAQSAVRLGGRPLMEVLIAKRRRAGRLLAWVAQYVEREHTLPPPRPFDDDTPAGYYSWPSIREMAVFRLRRLWRPAGRMSGEAPSAHAWPHEMARGDESL